MEALTAYGIFRLAPCVYELRNAGYPIETLLKRDGGGHQYARYMMAKVS